MVKKIKSEKELFEILKAFSKTSIKESKDPAQKNYAKSLRKEMDNFGTSLVKEQEADSQDAEQEVEKEEDESQDNEQEVEKEVEQQEETPDSPEEFGKSLEDILSSLNLVRAGKSTKNKEIKGEIQNYYDRLDDNERKILHIFLKELASILLGAISGTKAIDPSEPPFNFDVVADELPDSNVNNATVADKKSPPVQQKPQEKQSELEDTTPPIKVNERQDLQEIKRKVSKLMKRIN